MAVITTDAPVELYEPDALTDDECATFLEDFERTGSMRASARRSGVKRHGVALRRYADPQFRNALRTVRFRRMRVAGDELFASIDELRSLCGGDHEVALDELINCSFDGFGQRQPTLKPERFDAARERLHQAGLAWAIAVVHVAGADPDRTAAGRVREGGADPGIRALIESLAENLGVPISGLDAEIERLSNGGE
jgi:hypothetical protein